MTAVLGPGAGDSVRVYGGALRKTRVSSPGTDLAKELHTLLSALISLVATREDKAHQEFLREIEAWPSADLLKGGNYEASTHFDETSFKYRSILKTYRRSKSGE